MWVFLNNAMVSAVEDRTNPARLVVRARLAGDLERLFPRRKVRTTPAADYRFRVTVPRAVFEAALVTAAKAIDYSNFKSSIPYTDRARSSAYHRVWGVMEGAQEEAAGNRPMRGLSVMESTEAAFAREFGDVLP